MQKIPNPINSRRKPKTPYLKFSALRCKYAPNSISISAITRKIVKFMLILSFLS